MRSLKMIHIKYSYLLLFLLFSIFLPLHAAEKIPALLAMEGNKIVTAAGVRVRTAIKLDAKIVDKLALGTIVKASKRTREKVRTGSVTGYWYYVSYDNKGSSKTGWVFGKLLRDFKEAKAESIHWKLVKERRAKKKASFADEAQLYAYISSIVTTIKTTTTRADLELERLLTLQRAVEKIPYDKYKVKPYSLFLAKHKKMLFYGEIQGIYIVYQQHYWTLAERYAKSKAGDKLTWYAAIAPVGGECEGIPSCMFGRMMLQEGAYLQRYTDGKYADKALKGVTEVVTYMIKALREHPKEYDYIHFSEIKKDHQSLIKTLKKGKSVATLRKKVIKQLQVLPTLIKP